MATGLTALDHKIVAPQNKVRELEKVAGTSQDAKAISQKVITTQAEHCYKQQRTVEQLVACIAHKQRVTMNTVSFNFPSLFSH